MGYEASTVTFSTLFREVLRDAPTDYPQIATEIPSNTRAPRASCAPFGWEMR